MTLVNIRQYDGVCILHAGVELASYLVNLYHLYRHAEDIA